MWTEMVFQNIHSIFIPMISRWEKLSPNYVLPVYTTHSGGYLLACRDNITEENCSELNVLTRDGVESICMRCSHSIKCSVNKRERGDTFSHEDRSDKFIYRWEDSVVGMLKEETVNVPFLALFKNLEEKLKNSTMEIELVAELYDLRFDYYRLLQNIDILMSTPIDTLIKYPTIVSFIENSGTENYSLKNHLNLLKAMIWRFDMEQFKTAIGTMQL